LKDIVIAGDTGFLSGSGKDKAINSRLWIQQDYVV